ncbi:MAG: DUF5131 family protein [Mangrovibacterium sp.]
MEPKTFKGKAIYNPSGRAGEYSRWACNFYKGCSNGCEYCYCKKGILKPVMGMDKPQLKKCFKDDNHAFNIFLKEIEQHAEDMRKHGLFFSFTTDPMLDKTIDLTLDAALNAAMMNIPVKILTKRAEWVDELLKEFKRHEVNIYDVIHKDKPFESKKHLWAFGFTLTGHDELEPGASTNAERIEAMRKLHDAGFKTWASIEPIIDFESSYRMILESLDYCDLYKIGLESGKKYRKSDLLYFIDFIVCELVVPVYFKDSLLKAAETSRESLPSNCVTRDYNMFQP